MNPILGAIGSPMGGFGMNLLSGIFQNQQWNQFQQQLAANNQQGQNILNQLGVNNLSNPNTQAQNLSNQGMGIANRTFSPLAIQQQMQAFSPMSQGYAALPGQIAGQQVSANRSFGNAAYGINQGLAGQQAAVNRGYQGELERARGIVGSISDQQTQDVNRRYGEMSRDVMSNLSQRGLAGSSVVGSMQSGIERERGAELRRVNDQTAMQQLGVESQFGLSGLQAQQQGAQYGAGMAGNLAGTGLSGQLNAAGTNLSAGAAGLAGQTGIAQYGMDSRMQGALARLGALNQFGTLPLQTGMGVGQMGLNWYGPHNTLVAPQYTPPAQIAPHG